MNLDLAETGLGPLNSVVALGVADRTLMQQPEIGFGGIPGFCEVAGGVPHPEFSAIVKNGAVKVRGNLVGRLRVLPAGPHDRLLADIGFRKVVAHVLAQGQEHFIDGEQHRLFLDRNSG